MTKHTIGTRKEKKEMLKGEEVRTGYGYNV